MALGVCVSPAAGSPSSPFLEFEGTFCIQSASQLCKGVGGGKVRVIICISSVVFKGSQMADFFPSVVKEFQGILWL